MSRTQEVGAPCLADTARRTPGRCWWEAWQRRTRVPRGWAAAGLDQPQVPPPAPGSAPPLTRPRPHGETTQVRPGWNMVPIQRRLPTGCQAPLGPCLPAPGRAPLAPRGTHPHSFCPGGSQVRGSRPRDGKRSLAPHGAARVTTAGELAVSVVAPAHPQVRAEPAAVASAPAGWLRAPTLTWP